MRSLCLIDNLALNIRILVLKAVHSFNVMHVKRSGAQQQAPRHRSGSQSARIGWVDRLAEVLKLTESTFVEPAMTARRRSATVAVLPKQLCTGGAVWCKRLTSGRLNAASAISIAV